MLAYPQGLRGPRRANSSDLPRRRHPRSVCKRFEWTYKTGSYPGTVEDQLIPCVLSSAPHVTAVPKQHSLRPSPRSSRSIGEKISISLFLRPDPSWTVHPCSDIHPWIACPRAVFERFVHPEEGHVSGSGKSRRCSRLPAIRVDVASRRRAREGEKKVSTGIVFSKRTVSSHDSDFFRTLCRR